MRSRLKRVRLQNVCNIRELDEEFGPGLIGILGPNGSGKSTLLNAAYGCITNDFSWHHAGKSGVPSLGRGTAPSWIEVTLDTDAGDVVITRRLHPDSESEMIFDGKKITSVAGIADQVTRLLGAGPDVIRNFIFVDQWQVFGFLVATATVRSNFFSAICDTQRAEQIWRMAGEMLAQDQKHDRSKELQGELKTLVVQRDNLEKLIATQRQTLLSLDQQLPSEDTVKRAKRAVARAEEAEQASRRLPDLQTSIQSLDAQLAPVRLAATKVTEELSIRQEQRLSLSKTLAEVEQLREQAGAEAIAEQTRRGAEKALSDLESNWESVCLQVEATEHQARENSLTAVETERQTFLASELSRIDRQLQLWALNKPECPTCGHPVGAHLECDGQAYSPADLKKLARQFRSEAAALSKRAADSQAARTLLQTLRPQKERLGKQLAQARADVGELPEVPTDAAQRHQSALQQCQRLREQLRRADEQIPELQQQALQAHRKVETLEAKLQTLENQRNDLLALVDNQVASNVLTRAREQLQLFNTTTEAIAAARAVLDSHELMLTSVTENLETLEEKTKALKPLLGWLARLEDIREVFHRDNLPKRATQTVMQDLLTGINTTLQEFNAPFLATISEVDNQFMARFPQGEVAPKSISGAQKVMLALAIRLSVGFGFLALDEPTAGLDRQNLAGITDTFSRIRERLRNAGGQVIVVTHEAELTRVFDQVIQLGD